MRFSAFCLKPFAKPAVVAVAMLAALGATPAPHAQAVAADAAIPAGEVAADSLRVVLQDRPPFKAQLEQEVALLKAEAAAIAASGSKTAKEDADVAAKEAKRLAEKEIPHIPADGLSVRQRVEQWDPKATAIIICDMWNEHWCKHATARVAEMAPHMNEVLTAARAKGIRIVHAPSETLTFYEKHPARLRAAPYAKPVKNKWYGKISSEKDKSAGLNVVRGGCPECQNGHPWTRQIETLTISDDDFISDNGAEIIGYFKDKGVKNVIVMGVHTNMCVIGRPFGLRSMRHNGFNTALMRDMTDLMYNNVIGREAKAQGGGSPHINHFSGLDVQVAYTEAYVCPTLLSSDITGKKPFRFKEDTRPRVAFLTAESEYRASQRFQEFGAELNRRGIHADYALGRPVMNGPGRHNLENLQILDDANLAIVFIRRRALAPEKMSQIKAYVASGRPLFGIRTASHAFDAAGNVPRSGGGIVAAKTNADSTLQQWKDFDKDVLGGNYKGHYGHLKTGTIFNVVAEQKDHPILKGVDPAFTSLNWLYKNTPLRSPKATVLIQGSNPGVPDEPVFWINEAGKGTVIYTSLGYWDDWKLPPVKTLFNNTVDYLLALPPPAK